MTPQSPVLLKPNDPLPEIIIGKNQPEYIPLPILLSNDNHGTATMRYKLTWRERFSILFHGDLWLQQLTFHSMFQPIKPSVNEPSVDECI